MKKTFALLTLLLLAVPASAQVSSSTTRRRARATFAQLSGTAANGETRYCTNCQATSPCTSGGSGAVAERVNGAWNCGTGGSGTGDAVGPASSTDNAVARFDGTGGKTLQNSVVTVGDTGNVAGVGTLNAHTIPGGADTFTMNAATQSLSNKTLTSPRFASGDHLADANGNELIKFPATVVSAVNEVTLANAATGGRPTITASGDDTNIGLTIQAKGSGTVRITDTAGSTLLEVNRAAGRVEVPGLYQRTGDAWAITSASIQTNASFLYVWRSLNDWFSGSADTGLARNAAGVVEINSGTAGQFRDLKLRGLQHATGTRPSCDSTNRGMTWYVAGGAGVADTYEICRKDAADAYAWVSLF